MANGRWDRPRADTRWSAEKAERMGAAIVRIGDRTRQALERGSTLILERARVRHPEPRRPDDVRPYFLIKGEYLLAKPQREIRVVGYPPTVTERDAGDLRHRLNGDARESLSIGVRCPDCGAPVRLAPDVRAVCYGYAVNPPTGWTRWGACGLFRVTESPVRSVT